MKLLIDTQAKRVLFAEAGNDCVDLLFYILSLPIATVAQLLNNQGMVGSLPNLYNSLENLNDSYLQPNARKDALLHPPLSQPYAPAVLLLKDSPSTETKFYTCTVISCSSGFSAPLPGLLDNNTETSRRRYYVSNDPQAVCPGCRNRMGRAMTYVPPPGKQGGFGEGGFVKELVTYRVMDNLGVEPMSTISSIALLNRFEVKDVSSLEDMVVNLGMDEVMRLLKASLQSQTVLTDVFLKG